MSSLPSAPTLPDILDYAASHSLQSTPITLRPSPFPLALYNRANELTTQFNHLFAKLITQKREAIHEMLKDTSDAFTARLLALEKKQQKAKKQCIVSRVDYMRDGEKGLKLVEMNTISAAFHGLSYKVQEMHSYFYNLPHPFLAKQSALAETLFKAYTIYETKYTLTVPLILFVVLPEERNRLDQRWIEYGLKALGVDVVRATLAEIHEHGNVVEEELIYHERPVAVAYFRAGYDPEHFPSENEWNARNMIASSSAIECPSLLAHLIGTKKVQQVLSDPKVLSEYITDASMHDVFTKMYPSVPDDISNIVMKPQREGGGHNIFTKDIPHHISHLKSDDHISNYVFMELINPPIEKNVLVKSGQASNECDCISELGVYGGLVLNGTEIIWDANLGSLLRTKSHGTNEGGVASGHSCLDSPHLI